MIKSCFSFGDFPGANLQFSINNWNQLQKYWITGLSSCWAVTKSICFPAWWHICTRVPHKITRLKIFFVVLRNQKCSSRVGTCGCSAQNSQFLTASVNFCSFLTIIPDLLAGVTQQERVRTAGKLLWRVMGRQHVGEHVQTSSDPLRSGWALGFLWLRVYLWNIGQCRLSVSSWTFPSGQGGPLVSPCALVPSLYWDLMKTHRKRREKGSG